MSLHRCRIGSGELFIVELGQPEHQITVDGEPIGMQCADGSCRTHKCIMLAAAWFARESGEPMTRQDLEDVLAYDDIEE